MLGLVFYALSIWEVYRLSKGKKDQVKYDIDAFAEHLSSQIALPVHQEDVQNLQGHYGIFRIRRQPQEQEYGAVIASELSTV